MWNDYIYIYPLQVYQFQEPFLPPPAPPSPPACQMLQDAAARTRAKKEETNDQEGVTIMAPAITGEIPSVVPFAASELGNGHCIAGMYLEQSYSLLCPSPLLPCSIRGCPEPCPARLFFCQGGRPLSLSGKPHPLTHPAGNPHPHTPLSFIKPRPLLQGPLPAFSAENSWSAPRLLCIRRGEAGFGLSVRGSRPTKISALDEGGPAEVCLVGGGIPVIML